MSVKTTEKKTVPVDGYCPYIDSHHSIDATYGKLTMLGDMNSYARFIGYSCKYPRCTEQECPLVEKAKSRYFW